MLPLTATAELKEKITSPSSTTASLLASAVPSHLSVWCSGKQLPGSPTKGAGLINLNGPKEVTKSSDNKLSKQTRLGRGDVGRELQVVTS